MTKISELPSYSGSPSNSLIPATVDGVTYGLTSAQIQGVLGNFVFVESKTDLPAAAAGVIQLENEKTYILTQSVDLTGDRLVGGQNTTIFGGSSENCVWSSTGLDAGTALLSSAWSLPARHFAISHGTAINLDATGNADQSLDWSGVNFKDCATIGTIKNYGNAIFQFCAHLNSQGLTFDGSTGTIGFINCLFDCAAGGTSLVFPASASLTRRFRISYSSFIVLPGETGINVSATASIPAEGYILDTVNFGGGGTYITGVAFDDNKALFSNVVGVENSATLGVMTMTNNATATDILAVETPVKAAGTTTLDTDVSQKFDHSDNRLTYKGATTRKFKIDATASMTAPNNTVIGCYVAKNGVVLPKSEIYTTTNSNNRAENTAIHATVFLETDDYLEFFVENDSSSADITVTYLTFTAFALPA